MNNDWNLLKSVLNRNGFDLDKSNGTITIQKNKAQKSPVGTYLLLSIVLSVIGVLCILLFSLFLGLILLFSSVPMFLKSTTLSERASDHKGKIIEIDNKGMIIKNEFGEMKFSLNKIEGINIQVEKDKDISVGSIDMIMEDEETYNILEIFGMDKRYVQDDTQIIADGIAEMING